MKEAVDKGVLREGVVHRRGGKGWTGGNGVCWTSHRRKAQESAGKRRKGEGEEWEAGDMWGTGREQRAGDRTIRGGACRRPFRLSGEIWLRQGT